MGVLARIQYVPKYIQGMYILLQSQTPSLKLVGSRVLQHHEHGRGKLAIIIYRENRISRKER